ncbi:MAG: type 4a pilus biogenesis protein PilO [Pseudobdellovibrionaceae bacterium]|nr:type 4a pilus biogenesis protein PilO [Pseudobdellovibrionaceae bacterium]
MNEFYIKVASLSKSAIFTILVASSLVYWGAFFDQGDSLKADINRLRRMIEEETNKEQKSDIALKEVDMVRSSLEALSQQLGLVSAQLPRDINMAEVIKTIDLISKESGLKITEKIPKELKKDQSIEILPLSIVAEGSYPQLVRFVYYVTSIERIYRIVSLKVNSDLNRPDKSITANMEIASFRFVYEEGGKNQERR